MSSATEKQFMAEEKRKLTSSFIWRRIHSLMGLWLVIYLVEHLFINSQAALLFDTEGEGFITSVNQIHNLPYLQIVEILLIGMPLAIHLVWGFLYLASGRFNSFPRFKKESILKEYSKNHAYSWQRITSWILVVGIIAHVIHMRFLDYPGHVAQGSEKSFMSRITYDHKLYGIADRLNILLFDKDKIEEQKMLLTDDEKELSEMRKKYEIQSDDEKSYSDELAPYYLFRDRVAYKKLWIETLEKRELKENQLIAVSPNAGTAFLLIVRDTFKNPLMVFIYSLLVFAAVFHAFNGLWTFLITWGITLTRRSQRGARIFATTIMVIVGLLGLLATVGTYYSIIT